MTDKVVEKEVAAAKERLIDMEADRSSDEQSWREIAEYVVPRRDFGIKYGEGTIRKRTLVDTTAIVANERMSAMLMGTLLPPSLTWSQPGLEGREMSRLEAIWAQRTGRKMHKRLVRPRTGFLSAAHEALQDGLAFGNGVVWGGRNSPNGPAVWKAQRLDEHFWQENADGWVDTDFRRFHIKLRSVPPRLMTDKLQEKKDKGKELGQHIEFLHVVEPNPGGQFGGFATNKPYVSLIYCLTTTEVVSRSGYDEFPYAIFRFSKRAGKNYGEGPGLNALPLIRMLNTMSSTLLRAGELAVDPPLLNLAGKIEKLDRRPGGFTNVDAAFARRARDFRQIITRLYEPGNPALTLEMKQDVREQINFLYYIDWMTMVSNATMTATEVIERRDIRLRSMTPIVSRLESELLTRVMERQFVLMRSEFDRPPETLMGEDMIFDFFSPLARAQQLADFDTFNRVGSVLATGAEFDPSVLDTVDLDEMVRSALKSTGVALANIRSEAEVSDLREARAEREQQAEQIEQAQAVAAAARDAGQAISTASAA